ncbi:MAG: DUF3306 domain-containing protein [Xanthobacteraceae bacterium]|jgi:hypothetical protein
MSGPEDSAMNFLRRWSRRKGAAATGAPGGTELDPEQPDANPTRLVVDNADADVPDFSLAALPSIESITATTDIRAFLAPGVPEELARAALRRAWSTDPAIRDFIGIAENQWDFTKPDSVPGFGSLELTPELRRMVSRLIGDFAEQTAPARFADAASGVVAPEMPTEIARGGDPIAPVAALPDLASAPWQEDISAKEKDNSGVAAVSGTGRRKHGGALPR